MEVRSQSMPLPCGGILSIINGTTLCFSRGGLADIRAESSLVVDGKQYAVETLRAANGKHHFRKHGDLREEHYSCIRENVTRSSM